MSYFLTDLIINTQKVIKPLLLNPTNIVLQDRYYDAITTYINAYGKYFNSNCNIYDIPRALVKNDILVKPFIKVFCIPSFKVIVERMEKSKNSSVHDYYKKHPKFHSIVYEELTEKSKEEPSNIIIDTASDLSIQNGIEKILTYIKL